MFHAFTSLTLPYSTYLDLLKISKCHVYLTYPFVLSWSLLEAMASGLPVVGSRTKPVEEVIDNGVNGLLVDFFSHSELAEKVNNINKDKELSKFLGENARESVLDRYAINKCVAKQISLDSPSFFRCNIKIITFRSWVYEITLQEINKRSSRHS